MRAKEFVVEYKLSVSKDADGVAVKATAGGKNLGHAEFFFDEEGRLDPQTVWVDERYHGQGIARDMYDHLKNQGYTIVRSWDQTDAGRGFWNKHRGEDARVWEDNISEETMPELEYDRSLNYSEEHSGITLRAQIVDAGELEITASVNGEEIGYVNFASFGDTIQAKSVEVKPEYRRQGIATMMYDFAESLGNDIEPSQALTDPGKAFWSQRDPEADITE